MQNEDDALILVPVAIGELIDKITILEIKSERVADAGKLANIRRELDLLCGVRDSRPARSDKTAGMSRELKAVNEAIWDIEDGVRDCERTQDFGPRFVELARGVYHNNDRRAALKRAINDAEGSPITEEKSYQPY